MIVTKNLAKIYRKNGRILANANISITINKGEIFSLLGPNGAGKTTLIKILATLVIPTSGTAKVNGYDILKEENKVRRSIGLSTGRERSFYFRLTAKQNLEFFGSLQGLKGGELKARVEYVLRELGLYKDRKYMKYSNGMKKKLSLARALLADPSVYLLDEPTCGIDPSAAQEIREMIKELRNKGKTILLATHNTDEAEKLSDTIGILKKGRLIKVGAPQDLKDLFREATIIIETGRSLSLKALDGLRQLGMHGVRSCLLTFA